jgi:hypothetical protein
VQQQEAVTQRIMNLVFSWSLGSCFLLLFLFEENFLRFENMETEIFSSTASPHLLWGLFLTFLDFSLSTFYPGPSVINTNGCFLSLWHGTLHKLENHSICLPAFPLVELFISASSFVK